MDDTRVLAFQRTTVGPVTIMDQQGQRRLLIGAQVQGSAALVPGAGEIAPGLEGPGPVSDSHYQAGLLMLGTLPNNRRIAVAGLGAGTGVVGLLANFPALSITVIEIDPSIIELTREWFPLVRHYEEAGRLTIIQQDFHDVLSWMPETGMFDAVVLDAYRGDNNLVLEGFEGVAMAATDFWVNFIGTPGDARFHRLSQQMRLVGRDTTGFGQACDLRYLNSSVQRNILTTSQDVNLRLAQQFIPFRDLEGVAPDIARKHYRDFLSTWKASGVPLTPS